METCNVEFVRGAYTKELVNKSKTIIDCKFQVIDNAVYNNYIYGFWINQKAIYDWLGFNNKKPLKVSTLYVLCYIICVWDDPKGLTVEMKNGIKYVQLNDSIILSNLICINVSKRQIKNYISELCTLGLIDRYSLKNNARFVTVNSQLIELYFK